MILSGLYRETSVCLTTQWRLAFIPQLKKKKKLPLVMHVVVAAAGAIEDPQRNRVAGSPAAAAE